MFISLTVTRAMVATGETVDGEPIYRKEPSAVLINTAHIVAIEYRPTSTGTDLIIKTVDGDTWSFPGTPDNLHNIREGVANAND
jgi:hypothetical protein